MRALLFALYFVGCVVDYGGVFIQLGLKIILVDIKHLLVTLA